MGGGSANCICTNPVALYSTSRWRVTEPVASHNTCGRAGHKTITMKVDEQVAKPIALSNTYAVIMALTTPIHTGSLRITNY